MVEQRSLATRLVRAFGLFTLLAGVAVMHAVVFGTGHSSAAATHGDAAASMHSSAAANHRVGESIAAADNATGPIPPLPYTSPATAPIAGDPAAESSRTHAAATVAATLITTDHVAAEPAHAVPATMAITPSAAKLPDAARAFTSSASDDLAAEPARTHAAAQVATMPITTDHVAAAATVAVVSGTALADAVTAALTGVMDTSPVMDMPGCGGDCGSGHAGLHGCLFVLTALLLGLGLALLAWVGMARGGTAITKVRQLRSHRARPPPWTVLSLADLAILRI